jgi:hypothetical protein
MKVLDYWRSGVQEKNTKDHKVNYKGAQKEK